MVIEVPQKFEAALKLKALSRGVSADEYVEEMLKHDLAALLANAVPPRSRKTARGSMAQYGPAPTAEEIDANRADMFRNFGEEF